MRLRRTVNAGLAAALATVAGLAWYATRGDNGPPALTDTDPRTVHELTLEYPRGGGPTLRLERRRDGWTLTRPIERDARDGRVVSALGVLGAARGSCYPVSEHEAADFGLDRPRLRMTGGGTTIAFGDRAADGRRYVRAGDRFCLLPDRYWPLLKEGLDGLASPALLPGGASPTRIATPDAEARIEDGEWRLIRGSGDAEKWASAWRAARAGGFLTDPPGDDLGTVRIAREGAIEDWRIAAREPELVLVPKGAPWGLRIPAEQAAHLLAPPAPSGD